MRTALERSKGFQDEHCPPNFTKLAISGLVTTVFYPFTQSIYLLKAQHFCDYFQEKNFTLNNGFEAMYFSFLRNGLAGMFNF